MFDLSLAEIMLSVLVAAIFIGPKELPAAIKAVSGAMRSMRGLAGDIRGAFDELIKETGLKDTADELQQEVRMIQGDDGKMYESYDTSHLMTPKPTIHKPDVAQEAASESKEAHDG